MESFSKDQNIFLSYFIKAPCSRMIQWPFISFSYPKDIPKKKQSYILFEFKW